MVRAISAATVKPDIFVNISGISHYKPDPNCIYTENSSVSDYDFMSKLCIEWENAAKLPTDASTRSVSYTIFCWLLVISTFFLFV